ncbi:suppressor of fused domain protein [Rubritalea tangerina]|uniref:Suppressor of fused domain protein n=1 Tax=Rubritalea tangerina TaxID=430798 RepID=A0ABW4ZEF4_9BACT
MQQGERSESGAPIYRYEEREVPFEVASGYEQTIDRVSAHVEQHIGAVASVYHEIISDLVHLDVHIVAPTAERNFYTLVTSGMSDLPMKAPEGYEDLAYSELMICLPADWKLGEDDLKDEGNYWPIRLLKQLARFPHEYQTWLWAMHTVPNGDPAEAYAPNTEFNGVMLMPPILASEAFYEMELSSEKVVHFHALIPMYSDEMEQKLKMGAESLFDGFDKVGVSELLDVSRPSVVKRKKGLFGFFRR